MIYLTANNTESYSTHPKGFEGTLQTYLTAIILKPLNSNTMECLQCDQAFVDKVATCDRVILTGGIRGIVWTICPEPTFYDITDTAEWETLLADGDIMATPMSGIIASMPEPEDANKKVDSCLPERVINRTHVIEGIDFNSQDVTIGSQQDVFWTHFDTHYLKYPVGVVTCDERFIGFWSGYSFSAKRVIDDNNNDGTTHWMFSIRIQQKDAIPSIYIPGLAAVLDPATPVS